MVISRKRGDKKNKIKKSYKKFSHTFLSKSPTKKKPNIKKPKLSCRPLQENNHSPKQPPYKPRTPHPKTTTHQRP
jgi:hypothetical protein